MPRNFRLGHGGDHAVGEVVRQTDQEVPGAHGGVADLEGENRLSGVAFRQARDGPLAGVSCSGHSPDFFQEAVHAGLHQGADSLLDDQPHEVVGRVVAARALAGEDVGTHGHRVAVTDELVLQQALVDRAELANAEVAIVDVAAAPRLVLLERKCVDDIRHHPVAEPNTVEQQNARPVEQSAVVRRQADGGVATVHGPAEIVHRRPVAGSVFREHVPAVFTVADIAAHLVAQPVVVVALVADRQQVAVLGIEDEQQPVEQDQRGLAHFEQGRLRRGSGDRTGELGEDLTEDQLGEIGGNALLVEATFLDGALMEGPLVYRAGQEGLAPEDQREELEAVAPFRIVEGEEAVVVAGEVEDRREIDLEKLLGHRARALIIEPPARAVGESAPLRSLPVVRSSTRRR